jgi:PEGA domain
VTLDRIVLTSDGKLTIREHMVGSAIEALELSAAQLWSQFGILTPLSRLVCPPLDTRSDVAQLALAALSLMAGRRIVFDEYPHTVHEPLERLVRVASLRHWFARALYLTEHGFRSAREASEALSELKPEAPREGVGQAVSPPPAPAAPKQEAAPPSIPAQVDREHPLAPRGIVAVQPKRRHSNAIRWVAIAAGVVALTEAVIIGRWMYMGSSVVPTAAQPPRAIESAAPPQTAATAEPAPVTPLAIRVEQEMPGLKVLPAVAPGAGEPTVPELSAPVPPRSGGFRVTSPIELHVLDGERLLGSSRDGPIIAGAGRREFDFVNSVIGYRVRREVDVKPGQITAVSVTIPNGRLNINATPWASVWIDGSPYGETPLGNLSIVPGEHEIVFRHPQLGERRERALVRPDTTARVAVNLQR